MGLEFNREKHEYRFNGRRLPSVTEIVRPLYDWSGVDPAVLEKKRQLGEWLHATIQLYLEGDLDPDTIPEAVEPYFRAFLRFEEETGFEPLPGFVERPVHNTMLHYAGMLDALGLFTRLPKLGGKTLIVDWKATYALSPIVRVQTAGYEGAVKCEALPRCHGRMGVQLKPDGSYAFEVYTDTMDWHIFVSLLTVHNWKERNL